MEHFKKINHKVVLAAVAGLLACSASVAGFRDERTPPKPAEPAPEVSQPAAAEAAALVEPAVVAKPEPVEPPLPKWSLDNSKTLKDNLDGWAREAGWNPLIWDASNYYQVRLNTNSIEGHFPEVLRHISSATGLNICAMRRDKYIRVTDRGVSCKEFNK